MSKTLRKKLWYISYILVVVFVLMEIILRIYNPLGFRLKGDQILLPVNQSQIIKNNINPKLDSIIINSKNSLGFRGPEKPPDFNNYLSVITVGGSTTECHFLADNKTWPYQLGEKLKHSFSNIWVNNAGLDGHSTFGHQVLLNDYLIKIKPKVILFLTGINDVENDQPTFHDELNRKGGYSDFKHFVFNNSEVLNIALNLARGWRAQKINNTTNSMLDLEKGKHIFMSPQQIATRKKLQNPYLINYRKRLEQLMDTCLHYTIFPVFMTQPILFGTNKDSLTGINLETFQTDGNMNGKCLWEITELYNQELKKACIHKNLACIDLATLLPKNSLYFYDAVHYTNEGAQKVAEIITPDLKNILRLKYPGWNK